MVRCEVLGCDSKYGVPGVTLYRFPPNGSSSCVEWHALCGTQPNDETNIGNKRVCNLHFSPQCYKNKGKRLLLNDNAKPTINLPPMPSHNVDLILSRNTSPESTFFIQVQGTTIRLRVKIQNNGFDKNGTVLVAEQLQHNSSLPVTISERNEIIQNNLPSSSLPSFEHENKRRKLENQIQRLSTDVNHYKGRSKKNRNEKNSLKMLHNCRISKNKARSNLNRMNMVKIHEKKMKFLDEKLNKYSTSMSKIFSPKQVTLLLSSRKQAKWTHGEMGKFITMRYKSNVYEYMRYDKLSQKIVDMNDHYGTPLYVLAMT